MEIKNILRVKEIVEVPVSQSTKNMIAASPRRQRGSGTGYGGAQLSHCVHLYGCYLTPTCPWLCSRRGKTLIHFIHCCIPTAKDRA